MLSTVLPFRQLPGVTNKTILLYKMFPQSFWQVTVQAFLQTQTWHLFRYGWLLTAKNVKNTMKMESIP
ncbi:MAG: hypothetical protein Kow0080_15160 [Candidatus Promineifilaceae bacterium]